MHLPRIVISSIPHKKQAYETLGDYRKKNGELHITVSRMNEEHEFLIVVHELIEWFLIHRKGIPIDEIDHFDIAFEKARKKGNYDEPGDDLKAPYYQEHQFATKIEKLLAEKLGVNWQKYEDYCAHYGEKTYQERKRIR